jgi:hypothetical protein
MKYSPEEIAEAKQLLTELAARPYRTQCDRCETRPYALTSYDHDKSSAENERLRCEAIDVLKAQGWEEATYCAGFIKRCSTCAVERTRPWILEVDPEAFLAWPKGSAAFVIDDLRELLPAKPSGGFNFL